MYLTSYKINLNVSECIISLNVEIDVKTIKLLKNRREIFMTVN